MQAFVGLAQLLERGFEKGLVLDLLSRTQGRQAVQSDIDAHRCRFLHRYLLREFDLDAHEPPICCSGDACTENFSLKAEILGHIDPSELWNPEAMISDLELVVGEIEARLAAFLALELRTASLPLEERRKGFAQIEKGLVRGVLGHIPGPGELLPPDLVEVFFELERRWFLPGFILPIPLGQRPIPHEAGHPCGACKGVSLF
ncbi:hypothetical protein Krac_10149 [Ktedonobacter racemifer DSM 44963]|uniref:Uncharacterized protein n=1 Tax=Ktedonobacter racemifer DSM 44963 TaxID=485913 RepID=D6TFI6_KTERA|nr:hypothetical protein Krac_10149 [Ktedonobacter racemifer DSM 44963]